MGPAPAVSCAPEERQEDHRNSSHHRGADDGILCVERLAHGKSRVEIHLRRMRRRNWRRVACQSVSSGDGEDNQWTGARDEAKRKGGNTNAQH